MVTEGSELIQKGELIQLNPVQHLHRRREESGHSPCVWVANGGTILSCPFNVLEKLPLLGVDFHAS